MTHRIPVPSATSSSDARQRTTRRLTIAAVLLLAAGLRCWNLTGHGADNIYYAAAVRSMSMSWHAFIYCAFDPAGFLAVDKPPVAFWLQVLCVKLFGYGPLSLHLPQAVLGVAGAGVIYRLTARSAGTAAGIVAALVLALMPVSVAVDRSNLPDAVLVFILILAAGALLRAAESGRRRWLLLWAVLVGLAFNTKMLAAWLVLPAFIAVYLLGGAQWWRARVGQLTVALTLMLIVSLSWVTFVELTPADQRPYVGGTRDNSMLSLALGFNGLQRLGGMTPDADAAPERPHPPVPAGTPHAGRPPFPAPGRPGPGAPPGRGPEFTVTGFSGIPGPLRLFNREMAGHSGWLLPFAVVGMLTTGARVARSGLGTRRDRAALLWTAWLATGAAVFSFSHGVIHTYYLSLLAPAIAGLAGLTVAWLRQRLSNRRPLLPIMTLGATAAWQAFTVTTHTQWEWWLVPMLVVGLLAATALMLIGQRGATAGRPRTYLRTSGLSIGLGTLLICPAIWSATPAVAPTGRMIPIADPLLLTGMRNPERPGTDPFGIEPLVAYLREQRRGERFLLAVPNVHLAAPIIISTGEPVMACGGFRGTDPILTTARLEQYVRDGALRHVMLAKPGPFGGLSAEIQEWVRQRGVRVPAHRWNGGYFTWLRIPRLVMTPPWGPMTEMIRSALRGRDLQLYDCRPGTPTTP